MSLIPPPQPTPYSQRPEWADVTPVPQAEIQNPLVPIFYTEEYKDAADYFRGVIAVEEMSERVLKLTEHIIDLNPGHYSAWEYRYRTLVALKSDLIAELRLIDGKTERFMKHYQIWHHRRLLMTRLCAPPPADSTSPAQSEVQMLSRLNNELVLTSKILAIDTKNYHTWAYRQWLLSHFDRPQLWKGEMVFIDVLLTTDVRNNSAWHHRFFVVWDTEVKKGERADDALRRELPYVKAKIALAPNNAAAWNYLRGMLDRTETPYVQLKEFVTPYTMPHPLPNPYDPPSSGDEQNTEDLNEEAVVDLDNPLPSKTAELPCMLAVEFMADICEQEGELDTAAELYEKLGGEIDVIRKRYWAYKAKLAKRGPGRAKVADQLVEEPSSIEEAADSGA